ncbi:MAG: hypothetical protein E4H17_03315, partial [Gemmatimonadales bacterium]
MSNLPPTALLLHNRPRDDAHYAQADAGVMDQVAAVTEAMKKLGIEVRVAAVSDLAELGEQLRASGEPAVFNLVESLD